MATGKALDVKPHAGNPHVRFDEGEVAPMATPRCGSLLYKTLCGTSRYSSLLRLRSIRIGFFFMVAAASMAASASIELKSDDAVLCLSEKNGAVESLVAGDAERIVPTAEAFSLQLLDGKGEPTRLKSSEFEFEGFSHAERVGVWRHRNGLLVRMEITATGGEFCFKPSVEGIPVGMLLEWFDGPQVCIAQDWKLFWPYWDGMEIADYTRRKYRPAGYRKRFCGEKGSLYPGFAQMQFLSAYKDGRGVYFSAVDDRHTPKAVEWAKTGDKAVRLSLQTFCGDLDADGAWRPKFHYLLRPYDGGWMEACEIYRDWVRMLPGFANPPKRPKWMYDSPVNLIYPVRGEGSDSRPRNMKPNRYFPYTNAMSAVEKYGKLLDSRIMALLMHWEGTAPWAPPYVWPPLGGEEELAKFRDALHARGDLLGVYCSGTAWTQISSIIPAYSLEQRFEDEHLGRHMMRGPKGEITAAICNGHDSQRLGYDMCLAEDWSVQTLCGEAEKLSRFGIDYCQFFDQNLGGGWLLCYAKHHAHPSIPGAWATDAMLSLQKKLVASTDAHGMVFGCESAAATPYVPNLYYNDSRSIYALMFGGKPVPGLPFVFHEWSSNFSGNMCGISRNDPFWRWMRSFHNGDMLSLVLGADDCLAEAWCRPWHERFAEEDKLVALVRRMNAMRRKYPSFLLEGRMIRPFVKCESRSADVGYDMWGSVGHISDEEVLTSFWENAKGERIGFASNWRQNPSDLRITHADGRVETRTLTPLEVIELKSE